MENGTIPIVVNPQRGKALQFVNTVIMTINNGQQLSGREAAKYERPGASKVLTPQCTEGCMGV